MKKELMFILPLVVIAGCLGGGGDTKVAGIEGLEILSFTSTPSEVPSGSSIRLSLEIENRGDAVVSRSKALAFLIGSNLNLGDTTGASWYNSAETLYKTLTRDLNPEDASRESAAEKASFSWRLTSPTIDRGQKRTDTFRARVYYEYETSVRGTVWVYSPAEEEAVKSSREQLKRASFTSTDGPLRVTVTANPDPPVLSTSDSFFTLNIKVENVGGGTIFKPGVVDFTTPSVSLSPDHLNRIQVSVTGSAIQVTGCTGEQELIEGFDLICDVQVTSAPVTVQGFAPVVKLTYGYYADQETSATVVGR